MPDLLYTSPRTNRSYTWVPDDPNYVPTDLDKQEYAAYIEQQETASEQPASAQPAPTQPTAEAPDSGQSIAGARLSSAIQGITTIPGTIAQGVGATFLSPFGITALEESGKYAAQKARELTPIDPKYQGNLTVELFGAGGQALGQLASAFATGGGTIGTNVALAQAAAMGAASGAESAERRGLTGINRLNEVLGYGASEVITERMFGLGSKSFFKPAAGLQAKAVKAGKTILGEGVEESAAGALTNIVSNLTAVGTNISSPDILSADALKSYARQGLSGLVGGTVFAGAQMAMGEQATQESITRKSAVIDGVFTNVTGVPDEVLIKRGAEDIKLHTFTSPIDAEAIDSAPDGAKVILESIYGNELEVPIGEPTPEQNQAFDEIIAADAAKKAAAAQPAEQKALEDAAYAEANTWDLANRVSRSDEWFEGGNVDPDAIQGYQDSEAAGGMQLQAHGMSKEATLSGGVRNLLGLLRNGLDMSRRGGKLDTAPVVSSDPNSSGGATASGTAYKDGPFTLIARPGQGLSGDLSGLGAVVINQANAAQAEAIKKAIQAVRPDVLVGTVSELGDITRNLLSTPAVEPTPTPTPNATPEGNISESNLGQYPDGNEVGTPPETGGGYSPVEGGQIQPTVAQEQTVTQPLPSGATPTETGTLPITPMTGVSGGVAPVAAAPIGIEAFTSGPLTKNVAKKNVTPKKLTFGNKAKGIPPRAVETPEGNVEFVTPEMAPGIPQPARRTPLNDAVVKETVRKVFGTIPANLSFINIDKQVDGMASAKAQTIDVNLRYIPNAKRLEEVLRHEATHLIYQDPLVQADLELLKQEIPADLAAEVDRLYSDPEFTDSIRKEEAVVRLVERLQGSPKSQNAWQRFVESVRIAFRKLFGRSPTPRELNQAANRILERAIANVAVQRTDAQPDGMGDASDVRLAFAGEKSIQNLSGERRKFMTDSLDAAKAMAAAGKSSEEIRAVTGWFPGLYDGKLRYEIPDNNASFVSPEVYDEKTTQAYGGPVFNRITISSIADRVKSGKVVRLSEVFQHDELFAAYPEAANIPFIPIAGDIVQGSHRVIGGQDVITATVTTDPDGSISKASASTILHELQHFIQLRENFAVGGSPDNLITKQDILDATKFSGAYRGIRKYKNELDHFVKVLAEERAKKSFVGFGGPNKTRVKSLEDSIARVQETVNGIWEYQKKNLNVDRDSTRASLLSALNLLESRLGVAWFLTQRNEGLEMLYRLLSGEIEARDVQARQNLTPEQRKATAPYSSENIAKEDAIVMFGSAGPQMSVTPKSPEAVRHGELEAKFNAGTITAEEDAEAKQLVQQRAQANGYNRKGVRFGYYVNGVPLPPSRGRTNFGPGYYVAEDATLDVSASSVSVSKKVNLVDLKNLGIDPESVQYREDSVFVKAATPYRSEYGSNATPETKAFIEATMAYESAIQEANRRLGLPRESTNYGTVVADLIAQGRIPFDSVAGMTGRKGMTSELVVQKASQIKSAQTFNGIPLDERFDARKDDIRYSVTPESQRIDQEYLAAVEAGDMETAQRINKEVAKSAGYGSVVYRGIEKGSPVNNSGTVWATSNFEAASSYASDVFGYENPEVVTFYAKTDDIPKYDIRKLSESELDALSPDQFGNPQSIGVYANSDDSMGYNQTVYHLPVNNVKSANAVERNDAGEIILPSERFQKTSDDIRYSVTPQSPEAQIEQEYKVSVERGNAAVIVSGHELTREVYDELKSKFKPKPRDVFYVADTEVIRNPSDSDRRRMSAEVRSEFGRDSSGDSATRFTNDTFSNTWIWKSHQGMHFQIEPGITSREGVEVNQNNHVPDHFELVQDALRANKPVPLKVQEQYPHYAKFFAKLPPYETSRKTSDDIRYSVTPTAEDANEPEKYFPLTVQIFGEKVVATAVEVQSIREIYETVKSQVFDYTQEVSEDATKAARDLFDRIRPTEEGPADISWLKEIDSRTATPGAVIGALYAYSDKMQDGGRFQQEILDAIELSKYFPAESFTDFWTTSGTGGTLREAGRGLNAVSYLINGLNKLQNVHSNRRIRIQAAAKNLGISEADVRAIDNITSVAPTAEAVAEKMDEIAAKIEKTLLPSGANDPTKNSDNSPATDPKSIEQISAQKLVKDATKKDKKPKDTTQTDAVTAIVQDHLEKKGGQLEADLTRKLTEAGMSPEAAKKLATNTEKKLERDAKKESEREAKALEGAKELSDADRSAKRIVKNLSVTQSDTWDWPIKKSIDPIVALIARYYKANGQMSEEQLENALLALGVSGPLGRVLTNAATAELGKRAAVKAARDRARKDNAATKSAENFTKNWEKSQDPAQQTKEKTPDPVRASLNESSKVLRNQIHFDLSPNGKALFFDTVYTRLINLNVSPEAAMAATSAAYQKYLTNRANKIAKLRDTVAKEGLSKALAKQILNLTRTQQRDPEFAKQFIEQTLIDAGVPQDIANASVPLLLPSFQKALADAREKALMDFINGRPPSAKRIPKEKLDDLRKAVRLGATNPDYQPSTPFAKANGWQNFTRAEHDEMARQDEIASDPLQTNQERQLALSKIAKIASKRMPKNSKLNLVSEIYRNSALSNFLSTGGIQVYTPMFAAAVRTFTDGVRGLTQERNLNRFIASLEGFLRAASPTALKAELTSSFGQNITTYNKAYEIDDLSQLHQLLLDGVETWKTTKSPLKKAKALISITYGSMDYVRRSYAALDNVSQSVFYRQIMDLGMRDIILSKGGSETEFKNLISNRTRYHEQLVTELISQGQSPSRAWVNASELSYREMNGDLVDIYGDDVAVEIQAKDEMSRKESARELGVAPDTELDGHVIPVLIDTIKGLSKAADNRFKDSGKLTTLILFGFPITALKVMNRSLDYSPIGILRGAMSERESKQFANDPEYKSSYPSYKTDTQKQQRMAEAAVGTAAMIMFLMMVLNEREKEPEDRLFMVHNAGPRDRAARQIWRAAGNEPQSVQFRFSKDSPWLGISWAKAGLEVFTPVFATAGATFDSMDPTIRREDAYDQIMVFFSQTLASMSRPLSSIQDTAGVISGKEMSLSGRSLANQVGFRASSFLPWSSMARNYNKWQGARDTSNAGSAFAAMIPIVGPSLTEPALNSLGDPVGKTPNEYSYKIGTAIPVSVGFRREDTPLYEFLLNKGKFPTTISRPTQEKKYGQMTNETWRKFVEIRGQTLKSLILQRKESLDKMDSEKYDDMIENLTRIANDRARNQLKLRPAKK